MTARNASFAALAFAAAALLVRPSSADTHALAPGGGGLGPLDVKVDLAAGAVDANGVRTPIPIDHAELPPESDVTVEDVAIGQGRHVVHVRVPLRAADEGGPAWEALLAAGQAQPIFASMTGLLAGDPGERTGKAIQIVPGTPASFVLVGTVHEDVQICGHATTLLEPLALYPASLELRPATVQRLSVAEQSGAVKLTAAEAPPPATGKFAGAEKPLAQLLVARASSVPGSRGAELTDANPETVWREERPGIGQGEFVVMAAPRGLPITRLAIQVAPTDPPRVPNAAAPKTLYLVTSTATYEVALPSDGWSKAGAPYEVTFPKPIESACLTLVLDGAYTRGLAHPDVGLAELVAYSEFDAPGATLDDVAKQLSGERGFAAAQLLERAGADALAAVVKAYDGLDARGRALAIDVAASHDRCDDAAALLARGLCEKGGESSRKAREKLERCKGAAPALAARLRDDAASRTCIAPTLAAIAPDDALEPIADALAATPEDDHDTRAALRAAFARALGGASAGRWPTLLADTKRSAAARLELMRAAERGVAAAPAESSATLNELLAGSPAMPIRYLTLGPLAELARAGDAAAAGRIADAIARDPDWPVRARAAEFALPATTAALLGAVHDPEPRVREAAFGALATAPPAEAVRLASDALATEGWPFVKVQAVALLANASPSRDADNALGESLRDASVRVRGAAIVALARHRATAWHGAIRERLDDPGEETEVRSAAARALGALCDADSANRLTELAHPLASPATDEDAQQLGLGALVGLAALHPRDLGQRLAPLLSESAPPYARAAAQQAVAARPLCK